MSRLLKRELCNYTSTSDWKLSTACVKGKKIKYKVCQIIAIDNASPHGYTTIIGFWQNVLLKISDLLLIYQKYIKYICISKNGLVL